MKHDFEISLERLELTGRRRFRLATHILTANLLWPRVGIAKRSAETDLQLERGVVDLRTLPWNRRILFKESCEGNCALQMLVSASLAKTTLKNFRRALFGYALKASGELVDNIGFAGELAEAPLKIASQHYSSSKDADIYAEGTIDLDADKLAKGEFSLEIPLYSASSLFRKHRRPEENELFIGTATVFLRPLK